MEPTIRSNLPVPVCRVCGCALVENVVRCSDCETPHHRDCFSFTGRCAVYACTGKRYSTESGPVTWLERLDESGELVTTGYCVDFTSRREAVVGSIGWIAVFCAFWPAVILAGCLLHLVIFRSLPFLKIFPTMGGPHFLLAAVVFGLLYRLGRFAFDDYRVLDSRNRTIWLHLHDFGRARIREEAHFDDCVEVRLRYRMEPGDEGPDYYHWHLELTLRTTKTPLVMSDVQISLQNTAPDGLLAGGRRIAQILGVPLRGPAGKPLYLPPAPSA